jgi:hypothetical protein
MDTVLDIDDVASLKRQMEKDHIRWYHITLGPLIHIRGNGPLVDDRSWGNNSSYSWANCPEEEYCTDSDEYKTYVGHNSCKESYEYAYGEKGGWKYGVS